jgi:hypothetical protein
VSHDDDPGTVVPAYYEARRRHAVDAVPDLVAEDVQIGEDGGIELVRQIVGGRYDHLEVVAFLDSLEVGEAGVVTVTGRTELRRRETGELGAGSRSRPAYVVVDGLIRRITALEFSGWRRA